MKTALEQHYLPHVNPNSTVLELGPGTGRLTRHVISRCREMILVDYSAVACQFLRSYLHGKGQSRIYQIDRAEVPMVKDQSVDVVLANGVFEHLDAFLIFRRSKGQHRLIIAGTDHEGARFTARIKRSDVKYLGPIPHAQALELMARATLVATPSRSGEGLPRVCLGAIALGVKVILPPGVPEFQRNCADFVLPAVTPETIAAKMQEVLTLDKIPTFPWNEHDPQKALQGYVSVYEDLLGTRKRPSP